MPYYKCNKCGGKMEDLKDSLVCKECNNSYKKSNFLSFSTAEKYYSEIPREKMLALLAEIKGGEHWRKVISRYFSSSYPLLHKVISDESRADFSFLTSLDKTSKVLDIGSGWGTAAVPLARRCSEVVSLEGTPERLEFIKLRCGQEGIKNVELLCADILDHPLADNQFDLVIMNGVLEWIGESRTDGKPEELQRTALKNAFNLCKEGGALYVGIENRQGLRYLQGGIEDHTGLTGVSFLEREEADAYSKNTLNKPFRAYTHSKSEYERMLKEAGFEKTEFLYPSPSYKLPSYIMPFEKEPIEYFLNEVETPEFMYGTDWDKSITPLSWQKMLHARKLLAKAGVLPEFADSFSIIAKK